MKNKKGFTLVELLAVITLLAILMGIAVPNIFSTINNNKRNSFLSDAKRMIAKAEYLFSLDKDKRNSVRSGSYQAYYFNKGSRYLNEKNEFPEDVDNGAYTDDSYVKITYESNNFKYCICLIGSKRKIGATSTDTCNPSLTNNCLYTEDLTGIDVVKDK